MQFVAWLSGHSDHAWLHRMSVLSMGSSSAGVNPTITLNELQDSCNFHQRSMLMPGSWLIRTFRKIEPSWRRRETQADGAGRLIRHVLRVSRGMAWQPSVVQLF